MKRAYCFLLVLALLMLGGCGAASAADHSGGLSVVATIFPPFDFARRIVGEESGIIMLLPPGAESHSYEPTPQDIKRIAECDVFLMIGGESEVWADRVLAGVDTSRMTVVRLIDCAPDTPIFEDTHGHEEDHGHTEAVLDEHIWTSPVIAQEMAERIKDAFVSANPAGADTYRRNFEVFHAQLGELDVLFKQIVRDGVRSDIVFADRFPLRFFTQEYGLHYQSAYPGCAADAEPSAATVAALTRFVQEEALPAVFYLELSSERMADILIEGTGAQKLLFHSCHNVTKQELSSGETYLSLMRRNAEHLRIALG